MVQKLRKKKTCDGCVALTEEFTCKLNYSMHTTIAELLGAPVTMTFPDEPCPKPKISAEYMYWKIKGKPEE